jgi:hypothetical protein
VRLVWIASAVAGTLAVHALATHEKPAKPAVMVHHLLWWR